MVVGALGAAWFAWALSRTPWHYAFRAMRANESAAEMLGVHPVRFRVGVLALSGALAAFAGGVRVWYGGFIDPGIAFDLHITILAQIAPILGGIHTLVGPIIGSRPRRDPVRGHAHLAWHQGLQPAGLRRGAGALHPVPAQWRLGRHP